MTKKLKILTVFGTRPEIIKLAPFIKATEGDADCVSVTCATTQHQHLQNEILDLFQIKPDHDLGIMKKDQDLFHITNAALLGVRDVIRHEKPDFIVVQGDTTTAFASALAGFYNKTPIAHIEAGLRTGNLYSPFPEEANRSFISKIATLHMAPTKKAKEDLAKEGILKNVFVVGNTIVDSVHWGLRNFRPQNEFIKERIKSAEKKILITVHRRENFGDPLNNICDAVKEICRLYPFFSFIWPVHPNPNVKSIIFENLTHIPNLHLTEALPYSDLLLLINSCSLILSDSGGIQEEAYILEKKIIILREETERPEVVEEGIGVLAGAEKEKITHHFKKIINEHDSASAKDTHNIYGLPGVSKNILLKIKEFVE